MASNLAEIRSSTAGYAADRAAARRIACEALVEEAAAERERFVGLLFKRHNVTLLWYVRGLLPSCEDAEEVVQSAYLRLLSATQLEIDEERARGYLFKVAKNLVWDDHRRRKARCEQMHCDADALPLQSASPDLDKLAEDEQKMRALESVLTELSERAREVFTLHVHEEMTYQSIADALGVSKKTVEREIAMVVEYCRSRLRAWRRD